MSLQNVKLRIEKDLSLVVLVWKPYRLRENWLQSWLTGLNEDPFSGPENFTGEISERSESFKAIFRCEWAVVASDFELKNLPKFRHLFWMRLRVDFTS